MSSISTKMKLGLGACPPAARATPGRFRQAANKNRASALKRALMERRPDVAARRRRAPVRWKTWYRAGMKRLKAAPPGALVLHLRVLWQHKLQGVGSIGQVTVKHDPHLHLELGGLQGTDAPIAETENPLALVPGLVQPAAADDQRAVKE